MASKNALSVMHGAALWAATFVSVVAVAWIWSAAYVSFTTTDYAYPRTGGATNLNATMWNKLIDNVQDIGLRTMPITSSGGYVGIGTSNPTWPLQINSDGATSSAGLTVNTFWGASNQRFFRNNGTVSAPAPLVSGDVIGILSFGGYWTGKTDPVFVNGDVRASIVMQATENWTWATNNGTSISFQNTPNGSKFTVERLKIDQNGNVGIWTTSPAYKLDVNGAVSATAFRLPTGAWAGKILTSDASGNATWATPAAGGWVTAVTTVTCTTDEFNTSCTATCPATYYRTWCSTANPSGTAAPSWANACAINAGPGYAYCAK